jgi:hypothetical protein
MAQGDGTAQQVDPGVLETKDLVGKTWVSTSFASVKIGRGVSDLLPSR